MPSGPGDPQRSLDALAQPLDDVPLRERLARPGVARSTRWLLGIAAAVVLVGLGALVGRASAPATGPGSEPAAVGVVDGVMSTPAGPVITVRAADGSVTTLRTSPRTIVGVPQPGGPGGVGVGQQVTITTERGADGLLGATRIDVPR